MLTPYRLNSIGIRFRQASDPEIPAVWKSEDGADSEFGVFAEVPDHEAVPMKSGFMEPGNLFPSRYNQFHRHWKHQATW